MLISECILFFFDFESVAFLSKLRTSFSKIFDIEERRAIDRLFVRKEGSLPGFGIVMIIGSFY